MSEDEQLNRAIDALVKEERLLEAARVLRQQHGLDETSAATPALSERHEKILKNAEIIENAVGDLLSSPGDDWIKQGEAHGKNGDFTVYYKIEDGARLTCRIESPIPTSHLVPLLSVLNESELYEDWIPTFHRPFKMGVSSSKQLATFSRGHQVIQVQCSVPYPMYPREALFDVVAVDDIDANGFIIAKMTTITEELAKNLPNNFDFTGVSSGFEQCDFDGAVLFRACPTDHPNYASAEQKFNDDLILTTFTFFFDAKLRYVPVSLINFVTREAIGLIWNMLLNVAEQVRDGTRTKHCDIISEKQEFYQWVEERCRFMLQTLKSTNANANAHDPDRDKNENTNPLLNQSKKHDADLNKNSTSIAAKTCRAEEVEEQKDEQNWTMQDILRLNI